MISSLLLKSKEHNAGIFLWKYGDSLSKGYNL